MKKIKAVAYFNTILATASTGVYADELIAMAPLLPQQSR